MGNNRVDLTLGLNKPENGLFYRQYYIGDVTVMNGVDTKLLNDSTKKDLLDTITYRNMNIVSSKEAFLLPQAIYHNTFLRPGRLYSDRIVERTYSSLNGLGAVSQTMVNLTPRSENDFNLLDAHITLTPANLHYLQWGIDGTNSAGDLGVATNLTYEHRNFLKAVKGFKFV